MATALTGIVAAASLAAATAGALTLDAVTEIWSDVVAVRGGGGPDDPSGRGSAAAAPPDTVSTANQVFEVGTLRHLDNGIYRGTAADEANLSITLGFSDPRLTAGQTFTFSIGETANSGTGGVCAVGVPPCPDRIGFPGGFADETFEIGGAAHGLEIARSRVDPVVLALVEEFVGSENRANHLIRMGRIITAPPVPEPTSALLFGFGGLVFAGRLRRRTD